eukprot:1542001-Pyramimonas_sp.AAC.2
MAKRPQRFLYGLVLVGVAMLILRSAPAIPRSSLSSQPSSQPTAHPVHRPYRVGMPTAHREWEFRREGKNDSPSRRGWDSEFEDEDDDFWGTSSLIVHHTLDTPNRIISPHVTGPPVPITARVHSTPRRPLLRHPVQINEECPAAAFQRPCEIVR